MTDRELNDVLKRFRVPEPGKERSDEFPGTVTREIRRRDSLSASNQGTASRAPRRIWPLRPSLGYALAVVAALAFISAFLFPTHPGSRATQSGVAEAAEYYREIAPMFPNQVRAIEFDHKETRLVLADKPDVPTSAPIYLKICGAGECRRFVTFSGQQIRVDGKDLDVLVDPKGSVIVAGPDSLWSSDESSDRLGEFKIQAGKLEARL